MFTQEEADIRAGQVSGAGARLVIVVDARGGGSTLLADLGDGYLRALDTEEGVALAVDAAAAFLALTNHANPVALLDGGAGVLVAPFAGEGAGVP